MYFAGSKCVRSFLSRGTFHQEALLEFRIQAASEWSRSIPKYGAYTERILKHSFNSSSIEEDDLSELNLPVSEGAENLKQYQSVTSSLKSASRVHLQRKGNFTEKGDRPFDLLTALKNHTVKDTKDSRICTKDSRSTTEKDTKDSRICTNPNSVTIENVPASVSRKQLRKVAVSEFGEILNASVRYGPDGLNSYDVEFKTMESKERAVASGRIIVDQNHLPIHSLNTRENITVRISNVSSYTAEPLIHSTCTSCGPVEGLSRINNNSVDVVYSANSFSAGEAIVKKLRAACAEENWTVELLSERRAEAVKDMPVDASQVQQEAGSDLISLLEDVQREHELKKIYMEDLMKMHQAVVHLQNRPAC